MILDNTVNNLFELFNRTHNILQANNSSNNTINNDNSGTQEEDLDNRRSSLLSVKYNSFNLEELAKEIEATVAYLESLLSLQNKYTTIEVIHAEEAAKNAEDTTSANNSFSLFKNEFKSNKFKYIKDIVVNPTRNTISLILRPYPFTIVDKRLFTRFRSVAQNSDISTEKMLKFNMSNTFYSYVTLPICNATLESSIDRASTLYTVKHTDFNYFPETPRKLGFRRMREEEETIIQEISMFMSTIGLTFIPIQAIKVLKILSDSTEEKYDAIIEAIVNYFKSIDISYLTTTGQLIIQLFLQVINTRSTYKTYSYNHGLLSDDTDTYLSSHVQRHPHLTSDASYNVTKSKIEDRSFTFNIGAGRNICTGGNDFQTTLARYNDTKQQEMLYVGIDKVLEWISTFNLHDSYRTPIYPYIQANSNNLISSSIIDAMQNPDIIDIFKAFSTGDLNAIVGSYKALLETPDKVVNMIYTVYKKTRATNVSRYKLSSLKSYLKTAHFKGEVPPTSSSEDIEDTEETPDQVSPLEYIVNFNIIGVILLNLLNRIVTSLFGVSVEPFIDKKQKEEIKKLYETSSTLPINNLAYGYLRTHAVIRNSLVLLPLQGSQTSIEKSNTSSYRNLFTWALCTMKDRAAYEDIVQPQIHSYNMPLTEPGIEEKIKNISIEDNINALLSAPFLRATPPNEPSVKLGYLGLLYTNLYKSVAESDELIVNDTLRPHYAIKHNLSTFYSALDKAVNSFYTHILKDIPQEYKYNIHYVLDNLDLSELKNKDIIKQIMKDIWLVNRTFSSMVAYLNLCAETPHIATSAGENSFNFYDFDNLLKVMSSTVMTTQSTTHTTTRHNPATDSLDMGTNRAIYCSMIFKDLIETYYGSYNIKNYYNFIDNVIAGLNTSFVDNLDYTKLIASIPPQRVFEDAQHREYVRYAITVSNLYKQFRGFEPLLAFVINGRTLRNTVNNEVHTLPFMENTIINSYNYLKRLLPEKTEIINSVDMDILEVAFIENYKNHFASKEKDTTVSAEDNSKTLITSRDMLHKSIAEHFVLQLQDNPSSLKKEGIPYAQGDYPLTQFLEEQKLLNSYKLVNAGVDVATILYNDNYIVDTLDRFLKLFINVYPYVKDPHPRTREYGDPAYNDLSISDAALKEVFNFFFNKTLKMPGEDIEEILNGIFKTIQPIE